MEPNNDADRSPLAAFVETFAYLLGVGLAAYLSGEIIRRYHGTADRALDAIEAEAAGAVNRARTWFRVQRQAYREGPYVVFEAMTVARDAALERGEQDQ